MKYKTKTIEGNKACPEWLAEAMVKGEAVLCDTKCSGKVYITGYDMRSAQFYGEYGHIYYDVTPITAWEPQEGEVVLAWDKADTAAYPMIFDSIEDNKIWGKLMWTDTEPGGVGLCNFRSITPFSIELYTKSISEWPNDIEIISVGKSKEKAKEDVW